MTANRSIIHLDADAFFASVEQSADARLRGKPVAVGGEKRGIIASASYEARQFGIYTPMPSVLARRLCPRLILLPGDFEKYELFSRLMFSYAYDFTPDVEIGSIDEGYFDLTGARQPALGIAETIRHAIRQALKLSVSEGIGTNKLISQIASKLKKPSAFQFVPPGHEAQFLSPLANKWLPGIGPKAASQLNAAGLAYIGQVAQTPAELLGLLVGGLAPQLRRFAQGIDERPVVPARAPAKSYGEQETFAADTTDEPFLEATLRRMADKLMAKVRADGKSIRTVAVKVRYNDMDEQQAGESLAEPTDLETEIYPLTSKLLRKAWQRRVSLRLISLKLSNLYDGRFRGGLALDAATQRHDAEQRLSDIVDELREKFGRSVLLRGHDLILRDKKGRGEEPNIQSPTRISSAPQLPAASPRKESMQSRSAGRPGPQHPRAPNGDEPCRESAVPTHLLRAGTARAPGQPGRATSYQKAVVARQRLGNYAARKPPEAKARMVSSGSVAAGVSPAVEPGILPGEEVSLLPGGKMPPFTAGKMPAATKEPKCTLSESYGGRALPGGKTRAQFRSWVPLNVHSYYSFLDSTLSINAIIALAHRHELPAIALTDKNNLHGAVAFAEAAALAGIKPIIGAELEWHGRRVCLYVENQKGYHNLCRLLTPRTDTSKPEATVQMWGRPPGLPVRGASGSVPGPEARMTGRPEACPTIGTLAPDQLEGLLAVSPAAELAPFFPNRFYLETNSVEAFEKRGASLPCVASLPIHYAQSADRWKYDVVQSIRTLTLLRQAHPEKRAGGEYHFRPAAELQRQFAAHPQLLANSLELAERCSFQFTLGKPQFPGYTPPDGLTPADFLHRLVMDGLRRRYPEEHARLKPQLEEELAIITDVGYEEYFLVMWDVLQECGRRGIHWITRGSAADSLACYCLGISGVCPIRFDLYFRRFLNKDRMALNKLPDIDVDFPHDRKDDVIDLIFERFGPAKTAVVGGFSTFQSRSAFAEVAKVLGVSEFQVRRITERLPHFSRAGELAEAVSTTLECSDLPLHEEPYRTALQMAYFLDGFPRYPKMHPCGLVLSRQFISELTPCFTSAKGYPTTHFDMDSIESIGLIKMDILAQGGLAVMRDVMEEVGENPAVAAGVSTDRTNFEPRTLNLEPRIENQDDQPAPFKVQSSKFEVQGSSSGTLNAELRIKNQNDQQAGLPFKVQSSRFEVRGSSSGTLNAELRIKNQNDQQAGLPFKVQSSRFEVRGSSSGTLNPELRIKNQNDQQAGLPFKVQSSKFEVQGSFPPGETPGSTAGRMPASTQTSALEWNLDFGPHIPGFPSTKGPWDDPAIWELIASGNARAVHHIESPAMISLCKMCNVRDIDTLIAIVSVIRPGAANENKKMEFARRYQGRSPAYYPHPSLERCLRSTYGLVVYEEHILQICEAFAGLPPGRADILRRALAKDKPDVIAQIETEFAQCARRLGRAEDKITEVWNLVTGFQGYAFCKAHSTAYGVEAYQSAWLKLHYPAEFMAAVLTNGKGFYSPLVYVLECHRLGIPLVPPSINEPGPQFKVQRPKSGVQPPNSRGAIRVPLLLVKGLTQRTKDNILRQRERGEFSSLTDFFLRVQPLAEEMQSMIQVGAFDEFGQSRTSQYWQFKAICQNEVAAGVSPAVESGVPPGGNLDGQTQSFTEEGRTPAPKSRASGTAAQPSSPSGPAQLWLLPAGDLDRLPSVALIEPNRLQRLRWEEELLGYPASGHPLELFPDIAWDTYCPVNKLGEHIGEQIVTCGLVIEQRLFHQVTGEPMKFISIADWTGMAETELFAKTYKSYGLNTIRYRVLEITATVEPYENGRGHSLRVLRAGKPRTKGTA